MFKCALQTNTELTVKRLKLFATAVRKCFIH